ncbi:MAG: STAS domain-containing protein [cyanobacterium endosymbiont of Rhopalodia musculus]|uniref:STAS domain-containing protein n=1 Tax=cyanobacterium endosymbiont of Epithemia clementina EcSB TaxID=3034674 RepID=UPI002480682E|nr:STAS domain-containing protein [cyanobacterium endosymbiont of Epithemia clementina EcSB]WGT67826.1 STAS domain-containing protein [cyanobacterium endosymbiont of Epithemia clementina EcSB]
MMRSNFIDHELAILEPSGYITAANAASFQQELTQAIISSKHSIFLIDMHSVGFLDSAGLMALVYVYSLAESLGKRFSVCSLEPSVRIIFELTQLDKALEIFENRRQFELLMPKAVAA